MTNSNVRKGRKIESARMSANNRIRIDGSLIVCEILRTRESVIEKFLGGTDLVAAAVQFCHVVTIARGAVARPLGRA